MSFFIITGMSGSGKSNAISALEDAGFYCVDNVPPQFLAPLSTLAKDSSIGQNLALVVDARSKELFEEFNNELEKLHKDQVDFKLLFVDCEDEELLNRYKETRRKHPLMDDNITSIEEAIAKERRIMNPIRVQADYLLDTTYLQAKEMKSQVVEMCQEIPTAKLQIKLISFGYKYGIPNDADIVFDVRCLPNPFYILELKELTGLDKEVYDYVFSFQTSRDVVHKLEDILNYTVPLYIEEGKTQLIVAIGCTGGQHRSTSFVEYLKRHLTYKDAQIISSHRDYLRKD